uniref:Uncharacterized protein n=1 Tax=Photinus pyralis TaxID=7054 RepID=A0A1Y1KIA2_PHOPY
MVERSEGGTPPFKTSHRVSVVDFLAMVVKFSLHLRMSVSDYCIVFRPTLCNAEGQFPEENCADVLINQILLFRTIRNGILNLHDFYIAYTDRPTDRMIAVNKSTVEVF